MRRLFAILLTLALVAAVFAGCSANMDEAPNVNGGVANDKYESNDTLSGSGSESSGTGDVLTDRKLIRKVTMNAETEDMDAFLDNVMSRISQLEGYIESRNIQNGSKFYGYRTRTATLVIRIPAESLDAFMQQVSETSNVVSTVENSDDVTLQYAATESRLNVLRTEEARLLEFLSDAKSVSEMLEIERRLTEVQSEIESITTQLNTYDNLVDYGTVTLTVTEVEVYTEVEEEEPTVWQRIGKQFKANIEGLCDFGEALLVFFIGNSPVLLLLGLVAAGVVFFIIRKRKNK